LRAVSTPLQHVTIVGGCGHVGLPLAVMLAHRGADVTAFDIDDAAVKAVNDGSMPFHEPGADDLLRDVLESGRFRASSDPAAVSASKFVVVVIGTPVDEHLNPDAEAVPRAIRGLAPHLRDGQLLVLRSTVYPGVTRLVERLVVELGLAIDVAFCPERIAEGRALTELCSLPQVVAGRTEDSLRRASGLFSLLTDKIVETTPEEAELTKLFTNTWRYIKFAAANQFFMIANDFGIDYERIRHAVTFEYPRAADLPGAGFAAGPCLFKDTMQLAAFNNNNFMLGHASMMVNEGLPLYLVAKLEERYDLESLTVGILGMAFKADSDDIRSSLAYKLRRILRFKSKQVLCTDPLVTVDADLLPLDEVVERSDVLVIGAPHTEYRGLTFDKPVVDVWNVLGNGVLV